MDKTSLSKTYNFLDSGAKEMSDLRDNNLEQGTAAPLNAGAIWQQMDRILASAIFQSANRSRMFLRYVVERSLLNSAPKEYEIALEVLGRGTDYDPETDAAVRVEAGRLRGRLREYYDTAGKTDPLLIDIPKGAYGAVFSCREISQNCSVLDPSSSLREPETPGAQPPPQTLHYKAWTRYPGRLGSTKWWLAGSVAIAIATIFLSEVISSWSAGRGIQAAGPVRSLAVLPLQNLSGNPNEEYFADGMTDALITELAHAPNLRVVSRTSVMQTKGTKESLRQIASELGVDAVVEGSIVRSGDRVRVTAQLIDARHDRHLWAESFEEPMKDVLTLQDEVAREIAVQTQEVLAPSRSPREQINPVAYDAYLRGLDLLNERDVGNSVIYLRQAIALDSSYAAAYAGLAEALTTEGASGGSARPSEQAEALAAARRAIQLDPDNGEAYAALGLIEINYGKDWADAGRDLKKGLALSPSNALAEMQYSIYLDAMGRPDDAVVQMRRAVQLDPRSFLMNRHLGVVLYFDRRYEEALFYLHRAVELEPTKIAFVEGWISRNYEMTRNYDAAEQADLMQLKTTEVVAKLAPLRAEYERGGWKAYQAARLRLLAGQPHSACELFGVGESYLRLGDRDRAFSWLARGVEGGCYWADSIPVNPLLDNIRDDPRFPDLLKSAHLEKTRM